MMLYASEACWAAAYGMNALFFMRNTWCLSKTALLFSDAQRVSCAKIASGTKLLRQLGPCSFAKLLQQLQKLALHVFRGADRGVVLQ